MFNNSTQSTLCVDAISKQFSDGAFERSVLKEVSYTFLSGVSYALCGISGAGKSTLMGIMAGLQSPTRGRVEYNGRSLADFSDHELSMFHQSDVGLVFQQSLLIDELSVIDNIVLKGAIADTVSYQWADELLAWVGLSSYRNATPRSLSGGQQQRVALARALYGKPTFLLADEPTAGLDQQTSSEIIDLIAACSTRWGMGVIISSHDPQVAQKMDTVLYVTNGMLKESP